MLENSVYLTITLIALPVAVVFWYSKLRPQFTRSATISGFDSSQARQRIDELREQQNQLCYQRRYSPAAFRTAYRSLETEITELERIATNGSFDSPRARELQHSD